jgi:hypothetical protein
VGVGVPEHDVVSDFEWVWEMEGCDEHVEVGVIVGVSVEEIDFVLSADKVNVVVCVGETVGVGDNV